MRKAIFYFLLIFSFTASAQNIQRPKLVVGIVVDQMRWDYLYRYYDGYSNDGFKRLLREGFSCENTFIPFTPTYTAAGHACVYTGSVPALNGIIGNNWYDPRKKRVVYCTDDDTAKTIGSNSTAGKMSPRNLWSSTITDELRLATNFRNKTVAISLKDRGSILTGGHSSKHSYWFDNASGGWISSNFFMNELPDWVKRFNDKKLPDQYLREGWNTMYPLSSYIQSTADSNNYEGRLEDRTFPHITSGITNNKYESFRHMPAGNTYTFEMAKAAVTAEGLGKKNFTDFLAVSFSSSDYIGHLFGPNSIEVEDMYYRFDKELGDFLKFLDVSVGKGQYLLFLTADHAAAQNPRFLADQKIATGSIDQTAMRKNLNDSLQKRFNTAGLIESMINHQVHLNDSVIMRNNLDKTTIKQFITDHLIKQEGISHVVDLANIGNSALPETIKEMLNNGFNQKLSGDQQVILKPQWFEGLQLGTTHGSWNPYDSHIPLLWFGWKVKPGKLNREVYMTDIAPTLAAMLRIQMPNASVGKVIEELVK